MDPRKVALLPDQIKQDIAICFRPEFKQEVLQKLGNIPGIHPQMLNGVVPAIPVKKPNDERIFDLVGILQFPLNESKNLEDPRTGETFDLTKLQVITQSMMW